MSSENSLDEMQYKKDICDVFYERFTIKINR